MPNGSLRRDVFEHVREIDEYPLRRFGPQISERRRIVVRRNRTDRRSKHQIELAGLGQAAVRVFAGMQDRVDSDIERPAACRAETALCTSGNRPADRETSARGPNISKP